MNLTHPLNRLNQLETAQRILQSKARCVVLSAPTGSGKTAYADYAASQGYRTLAVVRTKSLQTQYESGYGFYSITGKADYTCRGYGGQGIAFADRQPELTTDICEVPSGFEKTCLKNCSYSLEREAFTKSQAGIINYAKFLYDRNLVNDFGANILFLDEAHELADGIVTDFSGTAFNWKDKRLKQYTKPITIDAPQPIALRQGKHWLVSLRKALKASKPKHPSKDGDRITYKWHKRMTEKVDVVLACLDIEPGCWFIRADKKGFTCKPLTSQFHFRNLFEKCEKIVLMSATVQKQDIVALGIDDYEFIKVPHSIPLPMRPVYDLQAPEYKNGMTLQDKREHAAIISRAFKDRPGWNGLVHTTSEKMACELADMMSVDNPIWIPTKGESTNKSYADWQEFNNRYENAICISWQFFSGADMGDVAINITARTPYPYFGDRYEKERFNYHPGQARVRVGNILEQQMGRNRRGFSEHYGPGAKKFNGIADGKWHRLKSAMQKDFVESVV